MTEAKTTAKKKSTNSSKKIDLGGVFSLTKMDQKKISVSAEAAEALKAVSTRLNRGRASSAVEISDVLSVALFQVGEKGLSFKAKTSDREELDLSMPSDAWAILEALRKKNNATVAEVIEELANRL